MSCIPINDFSLISLCDATKAGKLYSIVPDDGSGDFTVARNSTATYVGADGLIKTAAIDEPRIEFNPDGSYKGLLVEPQRTNLVFPSDVATTQTRTVTAAAHTLSFYGTGQVVLSGVATGTLTGTGANERVTLTFTPTAGSLVLTVTGSVTLWQLEVASTASSYIPTVASTVTRVADVVSKTGASALIGQTEGTIYVELNALGNASVPRGILYLTDGSTSNRVAIQYDAAGRLQAIASSAGSTLGSVIFAIQGLSKAVFTYDSSGYKFYVNGVLRGAFNGNLPTSLSRVDLGNILGVSVFDNNIKAAAILPRAITEAEAIALTS